MKKALGNVWDKYADHESTTMNNNRVGISNYQAIDTKTVPQKRFGEESRQPQKKNNKNKKNVGCAPTVSCDEELSSKLENLSLQNKNSFKSFKGRKLTVALERELRVSKKCFKKKLKALGTQKFMNEQFGFEAQMFDLLNGKFSLDEEQFARMMNVFERLSSCTETILGTDVSTQDHLEQRVRDLGNVAGSSLSESVISSFTSTCKEYIVEMVSKYGEVSLAIVSAVILLHVIKSGYSKTQVLFVCGVLSGAWFALGYYGYGENMKNFVFELPKYLGFLVEEQDQELPVEDHNEQFEAQGLDISALSDVVVACLLATAAPKLKKDFSGISKFVLDAQKMIGSTETIVEYVVRIFQRILDFLANRLGFSSYTLLSSAYPKVDAWLQDSRSFIQNWSMNKYHHNEELYDRVMVLENRAFDLLSLYRRDKSASSLNAYIRPLSNELCKIRDALQQEGVGRDKLRQPPVILSLSGASQIGKSRSLRPLVAAILGAVLPEDELKNLEEDFDSYVYSRQPEHKFWDGYYGQMVCFLDEKDLVKASLMESDNASTNLIRMGNVFPYVLHMAGIEQKGNTYFRSKFVITTSNVENSYIAAESAVRFPEAVTNRFHFEIVVRLKKEYAMKEDWDLDRKLWRLDPSKLPMDGSFDRNAHDYIVLKRIRDASRPNEIILEEGEVLQFDDLVLLCARKYKQLSSFPERVLADDKKAFEHGRKLRERHFGAQMDESRDSDDEVFVEAHGGYTIDEVLEMGTNITFPHSTYRNLYANASPRTYEEVMNMIAVVTHAHLTRPVLRTAQIGEVIRRNMGENETVLVPNGNLSNPRIKAFWDYIYMKASFAVHRAQSQTLYHSVMNRMRPLLNKCNAALEIWGRDIEIELFKDFQIRINMKYVSGLVGFSLFYGFVWSKLGIGNFVTKYIIVPVFGSPKSSRKKKERSKAPPEQSEKRNVDMLAQAHDPALDDIAMKIWRSNVYAISFHGEEERTIGFGFFSENNTFNMCAHYINTWRHREVGNATVVLTGNGKNRFEIPIEVFYGFDTKSADWAYGEIPSIRRHANITELIGDSSVLERRNNGTMMMFRPTNNGVEKIYAPYTTWNTPKYSDSTGKTYEVPVAIMYDIATKKGDCGLPIFIVDPTTRSRKFVGFHVAGDLQKGLALVFPKDDSHEFDAQGGYIPSTMVEVGRVDRSIGSSGVSKISRSPVWGAWGKAKKEPAHLRPFVDEDGEIVRPMEKAMMRYDTPKLYYDEDLVRSCAYAAVAAQTRSGKFSKCLPQRVSFETAILGIPGQPYMESLNRSTSPGYPWNMEPQKGFKGKERFFGNHPDFELSGPSFEALKLDVESCLGKIKKGERPDFYFCDSLKDELLPIAKARAGRTRMFCPAPLTYVILFRMYFMDFVKKFMESRIETEHAVGVNPYSEEWDMLYRKLTMHGKNNVFAGDFSTFDALQSSQILREIGEQVIQVFADRENDDIRRVLWMEVWNSRHIVGKTVYEWMQSLPSGHPATTVINCIFVSTVMRMCWVVLNGNKLESLRAFDKQVSLIDFGDDNVLNVANTSSRIFNQHTVTVAMRNFGLIYTSEDKSSNPPPFRSIFDVTFLKRSFRYEPRVGRMVAPLALDTILEMPYWTKKDAFEQVWRDNVDNALRELSLHPKEVFDEYAPMIIEASRERGFVPVLSDRNVLMDEVSKMEKMYGV